jgi:TPR repeat protein
MYARDSTTSINHGAALVATSTANVMSNKTLRGDANARQAVLWYKKAAANGHASASYNLGVCYANGVGARVNLTKARQCFLQSARQNHIKAIVALAKQYELGLGVEVNMLKAAQWYEAAGALNCPESAVKVSQMYSGMYRYITKA